MAKPGASGRVAIGSHIYTVDLQDAETRRQPGVTRASREDAMNRRRVALAIALFALTFPSGSALAQTYPNRPVRIIVPFAAGGAVDSLARLLGNKLSEQLNQPVVVENRAGAGGNLAPDALAKAAPDGYTILLTTNGLAISPSLYRTLPFDVHKDFVPVTQVVASQLVIAAHPKLAANSIAELIALARAKPSGLNYGSTGIGNPLHLTMEMLKTAAGIDIQAVPYRGRCAAQCRADRGRNPGRRGADGDDPAAPAERPAQGAGGRRHAARGGAAQRADGGRNHSRLRVLELAGPVRAGEHAARDRDDDPARNREGAQGA